MMFKVVSPNKMASYVGPAAMSSEIEEILNNKRQMMIDPNDNRLEIALVMLYNLALLGASLAAVYWLNSAWGFIGMVFAVSYKDERKSTKTGEVDDE